MSDNEIKKVYKGQKFTAVHCRGAIESLEQALSHVTAKEARNYRNRIPQQITRLVDGHRMSRENFPQEGDLPKRIGQVKAKKFSALKKIPIRGYCWLSEKHPNVYFISHYIYKDQGKLKARDTAIVGANWRRIEENGDEN